MPQLHLNPDDDLVVLRIELRHDRLKGGTTVRLIAENRAGIILASAGLQATNWEEAEELPITVYEAAVGFLYADKHDAVTAPANGYRARRKALQTAP
jgi:hypothetical protein